MDDHPLILDDHRDIRIFLGTPAFSIYTFCLEILSDSVDIFHWLPCRLLFTWGQKGDKWCFWHPRHYCRGWVFEQICSAGSKWRWDTSLDRLSTQCPWVLQAWIVHDWYAPFKLLFCSGSHCSPVPEEDGAEIFQRASVVTFGSCEQAVPLAKKKTRVRDAVTVDSAVSTRVRFLHWVHWLFVHSWSRTTALEALKCGSYTVIKVV